MKFGTITGICASHVFSHVLMNFGVGGLPTSLCQYRTWEKRKVGTATYTNLTWENTSRRGSVGQSELEEADGGICVLQAC